MAKRRPRCNNCNRKPARLESHFCSNRCAAEWADLMLEGFWFCHSCNEWLDVDQEWHEQHCGHR